jgi:hypothetical protein
MLVTVVLKYQIADSYEWGMAKNSREETFRGSERAVVDNISNAMRLKNIDLILIAW